MKRSFGIATMAAGLAGVMVAGCATRFGTVAGSTEVSGMAPRAATAATSRVTRIEI